MSKEVVKTQVRRASIFVKEDRESMMVTAKEFSESGLCPSSLRRKPADILMVLQMGLEMNLEPMQSMLSIDCIQGRPTLKPVMMLGMVQVALPKSYIDYIDTPNGINVIGWRDYSKKDQCYTSKWTLERAKKLGLTSKDNWVKQPMTMMKWRAVAEVMRTIFSDITLGLMTNYEAMDLEPSQAEIVSEKIAEKKSDIEMKEKIVKNEKPEEDIGEFKITVGSLSGQRLKDIDLYELMEFYTNASKHFESGKVPMSNDEKVLLSILKMYLQEKELID